MSREQLVTAVVACANREQKQGTLMDLVGPRGLQRLKLRAAKKKLRCRSALESVFPDGSLGSDFAGFHRLKKHVFRRRSVQYLTKLRSGSQIFDKCMSCMS